MRITKTVAEWKAERRALEGISGFADDIRRALEVARIDQINYERLYVEVSIPDYAVGMLANPASTNEI